MPKIVPSEELDRIEKLIAQYPEVIGEKDIAQQLDFEIKGRNLQPRLATLVAERRIFSEGDGRALKYKFAKPDHGVDSVDVVDGSSRIQNELKTLYAGNAIRFGLRPLEFSVWQQQYQTDHVEYDISLLGR